MRAQARLARSRTGTRTGTHTGTGTRSGSPRPDWMIPPHFKWNPHHPAAQAIYEGLPVWQRVEPEWMKTAQQGGYISSSRAYLIKPTTPFAYSMRDNNSLKDGSEQEPLSSTPPKWDIGPTQSVHGGARLYPWTPEACELGPGMCTVANGQLYGGPTADLLFLQMQARERYRAMMPRWTRQRVAVAP